MFHWLIGDWRTIGLVTMATMAIYFFASAAVRGSERRTLAEMSAFAFVVAVAIGSVVGRTATSGTTSVVQGCMAIVTLVAAHRIVGWVRLRWPHAHAVVDHDPVVLISMGRLLHDHLDRARLTDRDVYTALREQGIRSIDEVELLVLEGAGKFSTYRRSDIPIDSRLTEDLDD